MHAASEISPEADIYDEWGTIPRTIITASAHAMARLNQVTDDELPCVLSDLSDDQHRSIFGHLWNALDPRAAVAFSSASWGLRKPTQALLQQLRAEHEAVAALCRRVGMRSCKELREAKKVEWYNTALSVADMELLGTLGSVLPALQELVLIEHSAAQDGVQRLMEGLGEGALPAVTFLSTCHLHVGASGASALAAALDRGALPRLKRLHLKNAAIGDAGMVALAPTLLLLPTLVTLVLSGNPLGDVGVAALVAPPPPAGALSPPTGGLTKLETLYLDHTQVSDAGCTALEAALDSGALPALRSLCLQDSVGRWQRLSYLSLPWSLLRKCSPVT